MNKTVIISIILLLFSVKLFAQACCTAGTPLLGSIEMSTTQKGVWQFGLTYEYNSLQDVYAGSQELNDNTRERISTAALFEISYGLSDKVTLTTLFSFVTQSRKINPLTGTRNELNTNGIGDALFLLKYNLITLDLISNTELSIGIGVKSPLGRSNIKSNGILIPADMQPGTGSWDGILWSYFSQGNLFQEPLNVFVNASYRFNTPNERFGTNQAGYKFGNELITNIGLGYRTDTPFDFTLLARHRFTSSDEFGGGDISNTGGNWIYFVPGINIKMLENISGRLSGQIPVYRNINGTQLSTTFTASFSIFYSIGGNSGL